MPQNEAAFLAAQKEVVNARNQVDQNKLGTLGCAIADTKPDYFGRATSQDASLAKVGVFGDYGEVVIQGVLPYLIVRSSA
jgi:hypothetical protein